MKDQPSSDPMSPQPPRSSTWAAVDVAALASAITAVTIGAFSTSRMWDIDGHFHLAYARWVLQQGSITDMPWMSFSVFQEMGWVDHQLLFHLVQAPFSLLGVVDGAHASAAFLAAVAVLAFYLYNRRHGVPCAGLVTLLLLGCSPPFLFRLLLPRPTAMSLALLLLTLLATARGKRWACFALSFAYAWTYQVSLTVLPLGLVVAGTHWVYGRRTTLLCVPFLAAGLLAGFAINPYSPETFEFIYLHVFYKVLNPDQLPVGLEWGSTTAARFLIDNRLALGYGLIGLAALAVTRTRPSASTVSHLLIAAIWAWAASRSYKFIEYLIPFVVLSGTLALRDTIRGRTSGWWKRGWDTASRSRAVAIAALIGLAALANGLAYSNARRLETRRPDPERYRPAMETLCQHATDDDLVVHTQWGQFPELMAWCTDLRYVVGLDPSFMYVSHPEEFDLLTRADRGEVADLSGEVLQRLGGAWLFVTPQQQALFAAALADPGLQLAYSDAQAAIFGRVGADETEAR